MRRRIPEPRSLSIQIGRVVLRLFFFGVLLYGIKYGWNLYIRSQRAREIAPIHRYIEQVMAALKNGDYFFAQEQLDPQLHRRISVDRLARFVEQTKLNTARASMWGDWNRTDEANATLYQISGRLVFDQNRTPSMYWKIRKTGRVLHFEEITIPPWSIRSDLSSTFP